MLIDVRIAPGSRRNPHVARAELERWLPRHGVSYRWEKRLGGFRRPAPDSPDVAWREAAFPGYARPKRPTRVPGPAPPPVLPGRHLATGGDVQRKHLVALPSAADRRLC